MPQTESPAPQSALPGFLTFFFNFFSKHRAIQASAALWVRAG
jgi:hypothetical protein